MSKQLDVLQTIIDNLTLTLDDLKENERLHDEVLARIEALTRARSSQLNMEDVAAKRAEAKLKSASRVTEAVKVLGVENKVYLESDVCEAADCRGCMLCKYDYMQSKGMSVEKIKLVLGL